MRPDLSKGEERRKCERRHRRVPYEESQQLHSQKKKKVTSPDWPQRTKLEQGNWREPRHCPRDSLVAPDGVPGLEDHSGSIQHSQKTHTSTRPQRLS